MLTRPFFDLPGFGLRSHFDELDRMRRHLDQIFRNRNTVSPVRSMGVFPLINLTETTGAYVIRAELPGVTADVLDIQATGRNITISGKRRIDTDEKARYHRREREAGSFSRALTMPGEIDRDSIEADLQNGILTITVPKSEKAKARQISIKS